MNLDFHDESPVTDCLNHVVYCILLLLLINLSSLVLLLDLQKRKVGTGGLDWIDLAQGSDKWWAVVNMVMNLWVL
jgi:hypothetical protein